MPSLIGQWFGEISGGVRGRVLLNLERYGRQLQGRVLIAENVPTVAGGPPSVAYSMFVSVPNEVREVSATARLDYVFNFETGVLEPAFSRQAFVRERGLPEQIAIDFTLTPDGGGLKAQWRTNLDNTGTAQLAYMVAPEWSAKTPNRVTWPEFKREIAQLDRDSWIYRGQSAPWSLRTCFHRRGRFDLIRYALQDVQHLQKIFVSTTNQWLDMSNPVQHATLIAVAQHHGYPTPLLDWTRSPYSAAYFAVCHPPHVDARGPRIYALDAERWLAVGYQTREFTDPVPTLTILDTVPFLNPRAVQQQSVTTMCNIDNIEGFIDSQKGAQGVLRWFDFDVSERGQILDELEWMGVTESTLFPGLEGSFRTLARRRFPA